MSKSNEQLMLEAFEYLDIEQVVEDLEDIAPYEAMRNLIEVDQRLTSGNAWLKYLWRHHERPQSPLYIEDWCKAVMKHALDEQQMTARKRIQERKEIPVLEPIEIPLQKFGGES